ncbi:hypothetical protein Pyn_19514 [Prunus yedoensis var. nudiflora]|uniref:Uncharacterized protein n=1 Tax=Prunus yedoensis var. nudiflora TaxID=2094558 RepID=A0A314UMJ0_PRUYE|nr:hypothetical protein Pyn_19514 [Prunus yedoensis var. nudiflora]
MGWDFRRALGVHTRSRPTAVQGVVHGVPSQISSIPRGRATPLVPMCNRPCETFFFNEGFSSSEIGVRFCDKAIP